MPVRAHTQHGMQQRRYFPQISIFRSLQHTCALACTPYLSCSRSDTHTLFYTYTHARAYTQTPTLSPSLSLSPPTQTLVGFADVCPDLLPAEALLMPVCWLWVFHSLSYETRVGDIRAPSSSQIWMPESTHRHTCAQVKNASCVSPNRYTHMHTTQFSSIKFKKLYW